MNDPKKTTVISDVEMIYKHGDCKYAIWNYIPRGFWIQPFKDWFPDIYSYNATDFNYSVCFTMYLNLSPTKYQIGTKEFRNYVITNGVLDLLLADISVVAPYAVVKYLQYRFIDNNTKLFDSYTPFKPVHAKYGNKLKRHLQDRCITCLEDDILFAKVDDEISLENRTKDVRVYNCLFDDSDTWPK
ncbi:hypothetical protein ACFLYH_00360 [Candidatus Dependentiae bacterium]